MKNSQPFHSNLFDLFLALFGVTLSFSLKLLGQKPTLENPVFLAKYLWNSIYSTLSSRDVMLTKFCSYPYDIDTISLVKI